MTSHSINRPNHRTGRQLPMANNRPLVTDRQVVHMGSKVSRLTLVTVQHTAMDRQDNNSHMEHPQLMDSNPQQHLQVHTGPPHSMEHLVTVNHNKIHPAAMASQAVVVVVVAAAEVVQEVDMAVAEEEEAEVVSTNQVSVEVAVVMEAVDLMIHHRWKCSMTPSSYRGLVNPSMPTHSQVTLAQLAS